MLHRCNRYGRDPGRGADGKGPRMFDQHFLSSAPTADVFGPLQGGERVMWRGRCGVAEYAFDEAASLPRWTLPETTDVLVTDHRVLYACTADDGHRVALRRAALAVATAPARAARRPQHRPGRRGHPDPAGLRRRRRDLPGAGLRGRRPGHGGRRGPPGERHPAGHRPVPGRQRGKAGPDRKPGPDAVPPADRPGVPQSPGRRRPDGVAARRDAGQPAGSGGRSPSRWRRPSPRRACSTNPS